MTLSEFEIKRIEKIVGRSIEGRRPDTTVRDQLDISFRIIGQSFEIYEIRPQWNDPTKKMESPIAKATFVKSTKEWKLYWKKADSKWHLYKPYPTSNSIDKVLDVIEQDENHCFWG